MNTHNPKDFWDFLKTLGPENKKKIIPLEVYDQGGQIISVKEDVLYKWKNDFQNLLNINHDTSSNFDEQFYRETMASKNVLERVSYATIYDEILNCDITFAEVEKVVNKSKNGKSVGIDRLPYEVFKNDISVRFLTNFFQMCFSNCIIPSI